MSAQEIIEQIQALPAEEQQKVAAYVVTLSQSRETGASSDIRPGFDEMAGEVFDRYDELFRELAK
jgi:hypothetical protein